MKANIAHRPAGDGPPKRQRRCGFRGKFFADRYCPCHTEGMTTTVEIAPELQQRIDAIAQRSHRSPADVVADALENGRSVAWQEHYLDKVEAGLAAADRGEFASAGEVDRVLNRFRPA